MQERDYHRIVTQRLEQLGVTPNENLGQHFLIDGRVIDLLAGSVQQGSTVIEVGSGVGQLTEALAERAMRVVSIEIDRRYEPVLSELTERYPFLTVIYGDVLALNLGQLGTNKQKSEDVQVVASLPYHITEPFLGKIAGMPMANTTMVLGKRYADLLDVVDEDSVGFGKLSLLSQIFFDTDILATVGKESFLPPPRTDSCVIRFTPRDEREIRTNRRDFLLARLFRSAKSNTTIRSCLKEGLDEFEIAKQTDTASKRERHKKSRSEIKRSLREAMDDFNKAGIDRLSDPTRASDRPSLSSLSRSRLEGFGVPNAVLDRPFNVLDNSDLRVLSKALR